MALPAFFQLFCFGIFFFLYFNFFVFCTCFYLFDRTIFCRSAGGWRCGASCLFLFVFILSLCLCLLLYLCLFCFWFVCLTGQFFADQQEVEDVALPAFGRFCPRSHQPKHPLPGDIILSLNLLFLFILSDYSDFSVFIYQLIIYQPPTQTSTSWWHIFISKYLFSYIFL